MTPIRIVPKGRRAGTKDVPRSKFPEIWRMYQEGTCSADIGKFAEIRRGAVHKLIRRLKEDPSLVVEK